MNTNPGTVGSNLTKQSSIASRSLSKQPSIASRSLSKPSSSMLSRSEPSVHRDMSRRGLIMRSKQALKTMKAASQQFSKDIVTEEFYVLPQDEVDEGTTTDVDEFEETTSVSAVVPPKKDQPKDDEAFTLTDDIPTEEQEEAPPPKKKEHQDAENPETDFFEKLVDEDADKKQVVEEIAGMTEAAEDLEEETEERKEERSKPSTIQFKHRQETQESMDSEKQLESKSSILERLPSRKSLDIQPFKQSMTRRPSGVLELMKITRKSLLALAGSEETASIRAKPTPHERRPSVFKRDGPLFSSSLDFYSSDARASIRGVPTPADSRRSTKVGPGSFAYAELGPRYRQADDDDLFSGFDIDEAPIFFEVMPEEEEQVETKEEEVSYRLERQPYYERHDKAAQQIFERKIKNYVYHKKLAMYFKRKKMDYVTKEADWSFDSQSKYNKKLEAYGDLIDFIAIENRRLTQEIESTKQQKNEKFKKLTNMFKKMQDREGEIGYGLINTKTGNALPDKFVERLIRRQYTQMTQVSSMRLTYIRLKGMVQEKMNAIANLDEIAPGFLLADYEQLKSDNRHYADKIEEKDEELTRLRAKCSSTIQVLAHLREKTMALENDLEDLEDERNMMDATFFAVRSRLNYNKQSRDNVRHSINKMRNDCGLLTQPTLLKDMENGLEEIKTLTNQLTKVMKDYRKKAKQLKLIRKKIEQNIDTRRSVPGKSMIRIQSTIKGAKSDKALVKIYKGRPSLMMPVVEDSAFSSLKTIKPKLTYDRSVRNRQKPNKRQDG